MTAINTFLRSFSGRIIQITEALSPYDAVSNQVIELDGLFKKLGMKSELYAYWRTEETKKICKSTDHLETQDNDIIIVHYSGFSEYTINTALENNCTRILLYHNITPHHFFEENSPLYKLCKDGRSQLKSIIHQFHYHWADSQYNLDELIQLGAYKKNASVIPIIVNPPISKLPKKTALPAEWLFIGRAAQNKNHIDLIKTFAEINKKHPEYAEHLTIIGGYDETSSYYHNIKKLISDNDLNNIVSLVGQVDDETMEQHFSKSKIYVSCSLHEGFGVPLIEASLRNTPVIALANTATTETLGNSRGLVDTLGSMKDRIINILSDPDKFKKLALEQIQNANRFNSSSVENDVITALKKTIPESNRYKTISFVICTYNRRPFLERCLDYLAYQTNPNFEVVIVNGPSTDGTTEFLKDANKYTKVVNNPERNLSKSRNLGIENSSGDIIAFIDDDAIPFADWVESTLKEFNTRPLSLAAIGGPIFYAGSLRYQIEDIGFNRFAEAYPNIESKEIGKNGWFRSLIGTNCAFTKDILVELGGFDEQYDYFLDESDLTYRIQKKNNIVSYTDNLQLRHEFARSTNRLDKHSYNWFSICKNTVYFICKYSELPDSNLEEFCRNRILNERVTPLMEATERGEISSTKRDNFIQEIWNGFEQGYKDSQNPIKTRHIRVQNDGIKTFPINEYPSVSNDCKPLHICILSKEFPPFTASGGVGTLYYHLASDLLILGHKITIITTGENDHKYRQGRFTIQYVKKNTLNFIENTTATSENLSWSLQLFEAAWRIHQEEPIDVFDSALWDTEALAVSLLETEKRPPLIIRMVTPFSVAARTNNWSVSPEITDQYKSAEVHLIMNADTLVPISESISKTISKEHSLQPNNKWVVSKCGLTYWPQFNVDSGYSDLGESDSTLKSFLKRYTKSLLFIGRLEKRKGIDILLEAAKDFMEDTDVGLIVAGNDPDNWAKEFSDQLDSSINKRILFLGKVSDDLRDKLLAHAYCLIFPSKYESFGLVPLEAYVHELPVIASRAGAIPEVVEHNTSGLLFEPEDANDLAATIQRICTEDGLREQLSNGANKKRMLFSSRNSAISSINIYLSTIKRSNFHTKITHHNV